MNLTAHLRVTAEMHGVRIRNKPGLPDPRAHIPQRVVYIGTIDSERDYLVALHELGHVVLQHHPARGLEVTRTILREELEAWRWAIEHKRCALTEAGVKEIRACLGSYCLAADPALGAEARRFLAQLAPDAAPVMAGPRGRLP